MPEWVEAFAKVNLGLIVGSRGGDGYHPLTSLVQSISWSDRLRIGPADSDEFTVDGMVASEENLAWRAVLAVRAEAAAPRPVAVHLVKQVAVAAGLGGGSADAAAVVGVASQLFGIPGRAAAIAETLGSDVPFCLRGGLAVIEGRGERLDPRSMATGFALGLIVPPVELSTQAVYEQWDQQVAPEGAAHPVSALPPTLRSYEPLRYDLEPAAMSLAPEVAEWRSDLAARWGRPVAMSGSGPALFAYFLDEEEAVAAVVDRPEGARAAQAAVPVAQGWRKVPGTLAGPE